MAYLGAQLERTSLEASLAEQLADKVIDLSEVLLSVGRRCIRGWETGLQPGVRVVRSLPARRPSIRRGEIDIRWVPVQHAVDGCATTNETSSKGANIVAPVIRVRVTELLLRVFGECQCAFSQTLRINTRTSKRPGTSNRVYCVPASQGGLSAPPVL